MSANGPIVDPTTDLLLLTPINAHSMTAKSLILDRNSVIEIELSKRREDKPENASVTCDGTYRGTLELGDKIKVRRAGKYIKILKLSHTNFLETFTAYMRSSCDIAKAAEELGIHRNTLSYRINRLNTLFDCDLYDRDSQFRLHRSYMILKYLDEFVV